MLSVFLSTLHFQNGCCPLHHRKCSPVNIGYIYHCQSMLHGKICSRKHASHFKKAAIHSIVDRYFHFKIFYIIFKYWQSLQRGKNFIKTLKHHSPYSKRLPLILCDLINIISQCYLFTGNNTNKGTVIWGQAMVFSGYSVFLHQLQLADLDVAAMWQKSDDNRNSKF